MCNHDSLKKHGRDRKGCQRWRCRSCGTTVTNAEHKRPLGNMRVDQQQAVMVLRLLLEGSSIRACSRITGMKADTICDLVLQVGQNCDRYLAENVKGIAAKEIQLDEIWGFVFCKAKTAIKKNYGDVAGDSWSWFAIDADSKMILSHAVGKRDDATCSVFLTRLNNATTGRCQVTSDGYRSYTYGVPSHLGSRCDFAQLIKTYATPAGEGRYSPGAITGIEIVPRMGDPALAKVSTSYSERFNLSVRMHVRRFTRLTNAHSKTHHHHAAMVALFTMFYNYARKHETLKGKTPAMAAGLASKAWSVWELLSAVAA